MLLVSPQAQLLERPAEDLIGLIDQQIGAPFEKVRSHSNELAPLPGKEDRVTQRGSVLQGADEAIHIVAIDIAMGDQAQHPDERRVDLDSLGGQVGSPLLSR